MIPIHTTYIDPSAEAEVNKVLKTTYLSEGKNTLRFEKQLEKEVGFINPVAVNSGTTALHLALVLAGIKTGDEVIIPAQTFVATGLVVIQQGAKPVFADINYNTGNIDPASIRQKITQKTRAIIPVHWGGMPCDMDEITSIAKEFNLIVIEDAAHALGAKYKNKSIGSISDYTCFSFQSIKHVTTGDGGAIACKDQKKYSEALTRRWFGIDRAKAKTSYLGERQYDIEFLGFKYHLNDYAAALGLANLKNFNERAKQLSSRASFYRESFKNVPGLSLWLCPDDRESSWWLFGMHAENRNDFIRAMAKKNITASVVHQRIDRNSIFGGLDHSLDNQKLFDKTQVHIPLHCGLKDDDVHYIIETIKQGW